MKVDTFIQEQFLFLLFCLIVTSFQKLVHLSEIWRTSRVKVDTFIHGEISVPALLSDVTSLSICLKTAQTAN